MELVKLLEEVNDQESFMTFSRALLADKIDKNSKDDKKKYSPYCSDWNGWENSTIEDFLESSIAWAEDSNFGENIEEIESTWKKFALFLYCGKIYE